VVLVAKPRIPNKIQGESPTRLGRRFFAGRASVPACRSVRVAIRFCTSRIRQGVQRKFAPPPDARQYQRDDELNFSKRPPPIPRPAKLGIHIRMAIEWQSRVAGNDDLTKEAGNHVPDLRDAARKNPVSFANSALMCGLAGWFERGREFRQISPTKNGTRRQRRGPLCRINAKTSIKPVGFRFAISKTKACWNQPMLVVWGGERRNSAATIYSRRTSRSETRAIIIRAASRVDGRRPAVQQGTIDGENDDLY